MTAIAGIDIGLIAKLLRNPSDLPSAAKALGMEHKTIQGTDPAAPDAVNQSRVEILRVAFLRLATAAQTRGAEIIELSGAPAMLKGKRVRILAVLEDVSQNGAELDDSQKTGVAI